MLECNSLYNHVRNALGDSAYTAAGFHFGDCRVLRYHSRTPADVVDYIYNKFVPADPACPADIIIVTAIGVHGVNFKNITRAIHYGAPSTIEQLYQAIGRAGRAPKGQRCPVYSVVYTNGSDFTTTGGDTGTPTSDMERLMTTFKVEKDRVCLQQAAFKVLGEEI